MKLSSNSKVRRTEKRKECLRSLKALEKLYRTSSVTWSKFIARLMSSSSFRSKGLGLGAVASAISKLSIWYEFILFKIGRNALA